MNKSLFGGIYAKKSNSTGQLSGIKPMDNVFIISIDGSAEDGSFIIADEKGHDLETVLRSIHDAGQADVLRRYHPEGICHMWALPDRGENRSTWNLVSEYDLLLACCRGSIIAAAHVLTKLESLSLANALWGAGAYGAPLLMCFSRQPYTGEVRIIPQMERYLDREFKGFTRLDHKKTENILSDYGSLETFVRLCLKYDFPFSFRHSE